MGCCGDASGWAKIGLLCSVCALGLHTAGYMTNNWMVYNTVKDQVDIRVGLWWLTNCSADITCYSESTPSSYKSLSFTITQGLEGGTAGLLLIITIIYCFYVSADRSRTRNVAVANTFFLFIAVGCSIGGLVLWIIQINYPYFLAWSAGLTVVAIGLSLIALLCLIPDIKEYPYEKLHEKPEKPKKTRGQMFYTKHGMDHKQTNGYTKDPYSGKNSRDLSVDYGRPDPYSSKNKGYIDDDIDRFSLNIVTPSPPPRADFFKYNPTNRTKPVSHII